MMNADQDRVMEILSEALNQPTQEARARYLAEACGGDEALRRQVEGLLDAHTKAGDFLKPPTEDPPENDSPGTVIGRYQLLQRIGEGGFGLVYMAEQLEPVRRKVALKIIKLGMDTREVIARFEAERQALALMDHPNIARIFDAGVTGAPSSQLSTLQKQQPQMVQNQQVAKNNQNPISSEFSGQFLVQAIPSCGMSALNSQLHPGRPYFVMELVKGVPITDYCDQNHYSPEQRLRLFLKVCHAVQHAHQKGVIHRDLKPSNILVTEQDGEAVPKVIDFGVAKAIGPSLTDKLLFTRFEQLIGTPTYMSPEQAGLGSLDLDTRTDIYSLGVLLYQLLTGTTPVQAETLHRAALDEVRRMIRETEPPKPSTRLQTLGAKLAEVAQQRHLEPRVLRRLVEGDLDWIAMKSLEKDRRRRYDTADALAQDLERHLRHEPVQAGPPGASYRAGKFIRRHRVGVAMAAAAAAALLVGLLVAVIGFARARAERDRAVLAEALARTREAETKREAEKTAVVLNLVQEMLGRGRTTARRGKDFRVEQMLEEFSAGLGDKLKDQPEVEAEVRQVVGQAYMDLGLEEAGRIHLERALELRRRLYGNLHHKVAETLWNLGSGNLDDLARQEVFLKESLDVWRAAASNSWGMTAMLCDYARLRRLQGRIEEARQTLDQALQIAENLDQERVPALITVYHELSRYQAFRGDLDQEEALLRKILPLCLSYFGPRNGWTPHTQRMLGQVLYQKGQAAAAEPYWREKLAYDRWAYGESRTLDSKRFLRMVLRAQGKPDSEFAHDVFQATITEANSAAQPSLRYRLRIQNPGPYRLYLRWDSHDMFSDAVYAQIQELHDGPGGAIADVYVFVIPMYPGDADFATLPAWQGVADPEETNEEIADVPAVWRFPAAGDYTLKLTMSEDGAALDALVLQLVSLPPPELEGPPQSERAADGAFLERDGRVVAEAENFTSRVAGKSKQWLEAPREDAGHIEHLHYRGAGYMQALPDDTPLNPAQLYRGRGFASAEVGDYEQALPHYLRAVAAAPGTEHVLHELALVQAAAGKIEAHRATIQQLLNRLQAGGTNDAPGLLPWYCALAPDAVSDYAPVLAALTRTDPDGRPPAEGIGRQIQLGAVLYRAKRYEDALQPLTQANAAWEAAAPKPSACSPGYAAFFLSMAHRQLGHTNEARFWFQRGTELGTGEVNSTERGMPLSWTQRLPLSLLHREAQALLGDTNAPAARTPAEPPR